MRDIADDPATDVTENSANVTRPVCSRGQSTTASGKELVHHRTQLTVAVIL